MRISKQYRPEACASTNEDRFNITDAYLDVEEEKVVATNGRALVVLPVETDKLERSRYLAGPLLKAARSLGDEDEPATIHDQELQPYGILWPAEQMGRTFPDWKQILPPYRRGDKGTVTIAVDARLIRAVSEAMGTGLLCLTIPLARDKRNPSPIVVQPARETGEEIGVLMPTRADGAEETTLAPGQVCPRCGKVLASGAWCPQHGDPLELLDPLTRAIARVEVAKEAFKKGHIGVRVGDVVDDGLEETTAARDAKRAETERAADEILKADGAGAMTKKALKGPAAARKGGRRG